MNFNNNHIETLMKNWMVACWSSSANTSSVQSNGIYPYQLQFHQQNQHFNHIIPPSTNSNIINTPIGTSITPSPQPPSPFLKVSSLSNLSSTSSDTCSSTELFTRSTKITNCIESVAEAYSTHSTDFYPSSNHSNNTFLKLDIDDFIQSCISHQHDSNQIPPILAHPQINSPLQSETSCNSTSSAPVLSSFPPKISKNSRKNHSSSTSSLTSLVPDKRRKRNKRHSLPGERKLIVWKWNKATIKEGL